MSEDTGLEKSDNNAGSQNKYNGQLKDVEETKNSSQV